MGKKKDLVAELGQQLAADHTIAKAVAAGAPATTEQASAEAGPSPEEVDDDNEAAFLGGFESFDEVRAFVAGAEGDVELARGDMAVVNGGLVRFNGSAFDIVLSDIVGEYGFDVDHTAAFGRSLSDLEATVLKAEFEAGSLLGGVVDVLVGMFKGRPKQWSQMSQMEQRDLLKQLENQAKTLIRKVVRVVAEGEEISLVGKLERYSNAGTFDLKITANSDEEAALALFKMQGHEVLIRSADAAQYLGGVEVKTDPDEPGLPFADNVSADEVRELKESIPAPPEDDSDLADAANAGPGEIVDEDPLGLEIEDPDAATGTGDDALPAISDEVAEAALEDAGIGDYESRQGPDDFVEATAEELAAQAGRNPPALAVDYDYTGPAKPSKPAYGESWHDTTRDVVKYWNGKGWYLTAPPALEVPEPAVAPPADEVDDGGFPALPEG